MDKKILQERQRRKRQQLKRRVMIRLGLYGLGLVLLLVFLIRGVMIPLFHMITGGNQAEVVENTPVAETDPDAAVRVPLKGGDMVLLSSLTPGWHGEGSASWYQNPDGTYFAGGFQAIDGQQYYFNSDGYLATGWVTSGAKEYYFDEEGNYVPDMTRPCIALTFDDGPGEYTQELLDCLEENGAHATFFMVGQNVGSYPDVVKKMLDIGCELGNHSWNHPQLSTLANTDVAYQFDSTDSALIEACGRPSTVIRPPYGDYAENVLSIGGKPFILWCLDSLDWSYMDAELDYQEIMNKGNLTDGTVVLMHDIHKPSVECAKRIIPELVAKGYRLLTVSELAEAKNVKLQNAVYTDFWNSSLQNGLVPGYTSGEFTSSEVTFTPTYGNNTPVTSGAYYSAASRVSEEEEEEEDEEEEEEEEEDEEEEGEEEEEDEEFDDGEEDFYYYDEDYE